MTVQPGLYRKRPIVIEAMQYTAHIDTTMDVLNWLRSHKVSHHLNSQGIVLRTLEGDMLAAPGDYIIRGMKGEFYPCKPDIFESTYEGV